MIQINDTINFWPIQWYIYIQLTIRPIANTQYTAYIDSSLNTLDLNTLKITELYTTRFTTTNSLPTIKHKLHTLWVFIVYKFMKPMITITIESWFFKYILHITFLPTTVIYLKPNYFLVCIANMNINFPSTSAKTPSTL